MALSYINDTTMPILRSFNVDMNRGVLDLTFDETVNISTFMTTELTLVDARGSIFSNYTIRDLGDILTNDDSPIVSFRVSNEDLNAIKFNTFIFTTAGNSFLTLTTNTVIDMSGNLAMIRDPSSALGAMTYIPDTVSPNLMAYSLDLNLNMVSLTFDEAVSENFNPAVITLLNDDGDNFTRMYQIQGVRDTEVYSDLGRVLTFNLTITDQIQLKAFEDFATDPSNTFLSATDSLITDRSSIGNRNNPINTSFPLQATTVIRDGVSPVLERMILFDLNTGIFTLEFDEPVNISSIEFSRISILDSPGGTNRHSLVDGVVTYIDTLRTQIRVEFSPEDLAAIKLNDSLATTQSNTLIQFQSGAIQDQAGNDVLSSLPLMTEFFLRDQTGPRPVSFSLDMNLGILAITFNDVVQNEGEDGNLDPIDISGIAIQSDATGIMNARIMLTQQPDLADFTNSTNGYETIIFIPLVDLNRLKAWTNLATNANNTFLTLTAETIEDVYGNEADPIVSTNALPVTRFIPDMSPPILSSFDLDIDGAGALVLSFSETVEQLFLDVSQVTLVGNNNDTFTITSTNFRRLPSVPSFTINLGEQDLNVIKSLPNLASFRGDTSIATTSVAVNDINRNPITEITQGMPLLVNSYTPDTTRPMLRAFVLDMNEGALLFTFSETVNGSSFNPREITVNNDMVSPTEMHLLTGGSWDPLFSNILRLNISTSDLNRLKQVINLADSQSSTFISFTSNTVRDMESNSVSNPIIEIQSFEGMRARNFIQDRTPPMLVGFSLNLTSETLMLTFDETVNASSLVLNLITIQSEVLVVASSSDDMSGSGNGSGSGLGSGVGNAPLNVSENTLMTTNLTFGSENSSSSSRQDSTVITISLGPDDLNSLKLQTGLATNANNTFISFPNETIADMNGNLVEAVPQTLPLQVDPFHADFVPPTLVRFDLNLTSETISLTYSEVVNASSIDITQFTLTAGPSSAFINRTLTVGANGSFAITADGTEVTIFLGSNDLNEIKRISNLATSVNDAYLVFTSDAIRDMNSNPVISRPATNPIRIGLYSQDTINPVLSAFNIDVNQGLLTLEFSETVNSASLDVSRITLHSDPNGQANQSFTLTNSSLTMTSDGTRIVINISRSNLNSIKFLTDLAQSPVSTYLSIDSGAIRDMNFNPVLPISEFDSIPVSTYISDETGPVLESFELNLDAEVLTLNFDETVDISSLIPMFITIQSSLTSPRTLYNLSEGEVLHDNSPRVQIQLDFHDLNQLKLDTDLATAFNNTFIILEGGTVTDLALSENPSFRAELPLALGSYTADRTRPRLLEFSVNFNLETLVLNFNEPVNAMTLDATGITLLDGPNGVSHTLTGGNTSSINGLQIVVDLTDEDLNQIKVLESLFVSLESSFISITEVVIADMSNNRVVPILPQNALGANSTINDTTRPNLRAFDLDLDSNIMTLEFVETVNTSSINFTGIILQQASNSSNRYRLTNGTLLSFQDSTIIRFELVTEDLNAIKSQEIALRPSTTWLTLEEFAILDQNMQPVVPLENGINAIMVRSYTRDEVRPELLSFVLDLNTDTLTLQFSETVNVMTLQLRNFTLLSEPVRPLVDPPRFHTLGMDTLGTTSPDRFEPVVTVNLGRLDLNPIKEDTMLATSNINTYLSILSTAVQDMQFNPVVPIDTSRPLLVATFIPDSTPPQLEVFDFDINTGTLTLSFSESVNPTTLDVTQFTLQYAEEAIPADYATSFTGGSTMAAPTPVVLLNVTIPDLNEIKRISQLATVRNNTYIRVAEGGIRDMNENFIQRIGDSMGLLVNRYVGDSIPPNLVSFDLDLSTERLSLTFDETVNSSSWYQSGVTIQNSQMSDPPNLRVLIGGTVLTPDNTIVVIQLDASDLNYIKSISTLATGVSDTYLRVDNSSILDMADNAVTELINGRAIRVTNFTADDRSPVLLSFDLDLNTGRLQLTFNETINSSSLMVEQVRLQDDMSATTGLYFNSSLGTGAQTLDQPVLLIQIGDSDLNEIKRRTNLATSQNNTFLTLNLMSIEDTNLNRVVPITLSVSDFTEDTTPPTLSSFDFDLDEGRLHLTFSETVQYRTLNITEITIQSEMVSSSNVSSITLNGGVLLTPRDGTYLSIQLLKRDLDTIKAIRPLAMSQYSTFVSLTRMTIADMNDNLLVEIGTDIALMTSTFIPDTTSPRLQRFELDMNTGMLTMTFSETVDTTTLMFAYLVLQDAATANSTFQFQTSTWSMELDPIVYINISKLDLDLLKENRQIATSLNDTYISLTNLTILDTSGNGIVPIPDDMAQRSQVYVRDRTPPQLERFNLDVDSGLLSLFYSETIDIFSLDPTKITLQNEAYLGSTSFTLTGGAVTPMDSTMGYVQLTIGDLNEVKRLVNLGTCTVNDTYISLISNSTLSNDTDLIDGNQTTTISVPIDLDVEFSSGSGSGNGTGSGMDTTFLMLDRELSSHVFDMAGNPIISIHRELALEVEVDGCTPDTTRPQLSNFTLNMHNSTLILTFDETVNSSSLDVFEITFYGDLDYNQSNLTQSYQLQSGYTSNENLTGQLEIEIMISNTDLNELKRRESLTIDAMSSRISITQYLILDMNRNQIVQIPPDNATEAGLFIPDRRSPVLLTFELDLTLERLTLSFSETVNASSLNVEGITILNQNSTSNRTLVGGFSLVPSNGGPRLGPNDPILIIQLDQSDLNYIKSVTDLAIGMDSTFISIESFTVADMNGNQVVEISQSTPLQVTRFTRDAVNPQLVAFDLDIDAGELTLTFSETVNISSLDVSMITLQADLASPIMDQLSFTPGNTSFDTFSLSPDWPIILVQIGSDDLNEIKRLTQLATSNLTSYITLTAEAIDDMSGNSVIPISNGNATQVSIFIPDITDPILVSFSLDLNLGLLQLTYSETVDFSSLDFTFVTVQNSSFLINSSSVELTGGQTTNLNDSTVVEVSLDIDDQNAIKRIRSLATSLNNSYLSILSGAILDMNQNPVVEVNSTNAQQAITFMEDLTDPTLTAFDLDLNTGMIFLFFDETVEADSVDLIQITLQDDRPASSSNNTYTLTGGISSNEDSTLITVVLSFFDLNEIKKIRDLASDSNGSNSYISITNLTVVDMNDNPVQTVSDAVAIAVRNFTEDQTPPELYSFDFDLNLGRISLNFSETVDTLTFNITQFTLQSGANISDGAIRTHTLSQENLLTGDEVVIIQGLLYLDLNTIKSIGGLATDELDTYLVITEFAIRDMNGNLVEPISQFDALPVNNYTRDITRPLLESFDLDMNLGQLSFTFSETVNVSTLDVTEILLLNDALNVSQQFSLTSSSSSMSSDWPFFVIDIGDNDLNTIKALLMLATSNDSTYIQLSEFVIRDTAGNMNLESNSTQVSLFTADRTRPRLVSFDLDLTLDLLTLSFSETVSGRTFLANQLTLINNGGRDSINNGSGSGGNSSGSGELDTPSYFTNYTLSGGENLPFTIDSTQLILELTFADRNEIKRLTDLATSRDNVFISLTADFIQDTNANFIVPVNITEPLQVNFFTEDLSPPRLLNFDLNMDTLDLTLYFSETVSVNSLNVTQITLQGSDQLIDGITEFYTLTDQLMPLGSYSNSTNSSTIIVRISEADANMIKFRTEFAVSANTTYISISPFAIEDMNGNEVVEISDQNATRVQVYMRDATSPVLRSFGLNLTSERLTLSFDETIDFNSIQPSLITLQNLLLNATTSYYLRAVQPIGENSPILVLNLTATQRDLNEIKFLSDLATDANNTIITLSSGALTDLSVEPNPIATVPRTVDDYFADFVPPEIVSFTVNVNASTLTLVFNEVVNASSLDPTAIRLQNSSSLTTSFVDLTGKLHCMHYYYTAYRSSSYSIIM